MGAADAVKKVVTTVGSVMEENQGVVKVASGTGKTGVQAAKAVEATEQASDLYRSVKSGLSWARAGAAALSTIPVAGEFLGTIPQVVITGAELVTDVAGGQKSETVMRNLAANGAQIASDTIPGGGLAMLAVRGGIAVAGDRIRVEDVPSNGGMPTSVPGKTPERKVAANKSQTHGA